MGDFICPHCGEFVVPENDISMTDDARAELWARIEHWNLSECGAAVHGQPGDLVERARLDRAKVRELLGMEPE